MAIRKRLTLGIALSLIAATLSIAPINDFRFHQETKGLSAELLTHSKDYVGFWLSYDKAGYTQYISHRKWDYGERVQKDEMLFHFVRHWPKKFDKAGITASNFHFVHPSKMFYAEFFITELSSQDWGDYFPTSIYGAIKIQAENVFHMYPFRFRTIAFEMNHTTYYLIWIQDPDGKWRCMNDPDAIGAASGAKMSTGT